jgi:hypothetical protein
MTVLLAFFFIKRENMLLKNKIIFTYIHKS